MTTTPAMPEHTIGKHDHPEPHTMCWSDLELAAIKRYAESYALATLQAQPAEVGVSDAEIDALMPEPDGSAEHNRVKVDLGGGITGTEYDEVDAWSAPLVRQTVRAILALRPQAVTSEPGAYESRYAEWRQFYGNRITQWMSADELRRAVSQLMTVDAGSPELLLIHAMRLIDDAAPEWIAGEPANLQAAARDADEWLALIQRLNDAGRWRFSQPDSRTKLDGCRAALSKILCADRPQAVPMTDETLRMTIDANRYLWWVNKWFSAPAEVFSALAHCKTPDDVGAAIDHAMNGITAPAAEPTDGWLLIAPDGTVVATESTPVKALARISGYKPTVEGLLGFEEQGWRIAPAATAAEVPEAMGDEPALPSPWKANELASNKEVFTVSQLHTYAKQYAQWQSTRLRGGVPEGWSITRKDDGRIVVKAPNGDAWAWANEHSTGTSNDFVYAFLSALIDAPQAPAAALDAGVVRDAVLAVWNTRALTQRPAAQTEREAFAVARAFSLATMASEEFVRCNGLSTGEADEFILTGPDLTDEHATACVEHLKHVGECVAFDCDDGVIVRLGDFTLGSLS